MIAKLDPLDPAVALAAQLTAERAKPVKPDSLRTGDIVYIRDRDTIELSVAEKRAIAALKRLAKTWPDTLWLFSAGNGGLNVMRKNEDGEKAHINCGIDQSYIVAEIDIENDGGDW